MTGSFDTRRAALVDAVLDTAAFARAHSIALPADVALGVRWAGVMAKYDPDQPREPICKEDSERLDELFGGTRAKSFPGDFLDLGEHLVGPLLDTVRQIAGADDPLDAERRDAEDMLASNLYGYFSRQWRALHKQLRIGRIALLASRTGKPRQGIFIGLDWGAEEAQLLATLGPVLTDVLTDAARLAWDELTGMGVSLSWEVFDAAAQAWAAAYKYTLVTQINQSTQNQLGKAISHWIGTPDDFPVLVEQVRKIVPSNPYPFIRDRARLIAQTETTRVYAESRMEALKAAGLKMFTWQTANDELVCTKVCAPLHGKTGIIGRGVLNEEDGEYYTLPGHVGCRCWATASVEELEANVMFKHHGPGSHASGSPQSVHGHGDGTVVAQVVQQNQLKYRAPRSCEQEATAYAEGEIQRTAVQFAASPEQVRQECTDYLTELTRKPLVIRAKLASAKAIVDEGRFKSQFESGRSNGWFNPEMRKTCEWNGLGIPYDVDPAERPIYGCFDIDGDDGAMYGEVKFVMKESVKDRATFTVSDSLSLFEQKFATGSPVREPDDVGGWDGYVDSLARRRKEFPYLEAQIQGGVTLDDVESVTLMDFALDAQGKLRNNWQPLEAKLRARGIKVTYVSGTS